MGKRKYELAKEWTLDRYGITLFRIRALRSFGGVEQGELGGYVQDERNLSHDGVAWIYDTAIVWGNARVAEFARVCGNADVSDNAEITGYAKVSGGASVFESAKVFGRSRVMGWTWVTGRSQVFEDAIVKENACISEDAMIYGQAVVGGQVRVCGRARIFMASKESGSEPIGGDAVICDGRRAKRRAMSYPLNFD